jgi:translation initiation factor 1 (eIF-1/SUI1)
MTLQHGVEGKTVVRIEETEDEEEDISSYWKTLRKGEGTTLNETPWP